jgi:hypothetical protein
MSTVLGPLQTVLQTTRLDVRQWLTCTGLAPSIVTRVAVHKALLPRFGDCLLPID